MKDFFKSEPGKGEAMLSDLRVRPDLMGGAYIPMNLLIYCSVYEHGASGRSAFPATMTECYKFSVAMTITREKQKVKKAFRIDPFLTDLPPDVKHLLSSLGVLSFEGLTQEPPPRAVSSKPQSNVMRSWRIRPLQASFTCTHTRMALQVH